MRHLAVTVLFLASPLSAADKDIEFFEAKVRPVLVEH